jgi:DNA-directed RNA polymerase specialized sigma24 family protein
MKMVSARQAAEQEVTPYAEVADFCRIFRNDMNRLYLLSFLLTGDQQLAEECFARGLEDSANSNRVFKEWADSWARRTIIQNAIQMVQPHVTDNGTSSFRSESAEIKRSEVAGVIALPSFERFVFVISVLERYSDQDCALVLGCTRNAVIAGRTRALQQIAGSTKFDRNAPEIGAGVQKQTGDPGSVRQPKIASHLLAFA